MTTRAPSSVNRRAWAEPSPPDPPLISATLPSSFPLDFPLLVLVFWFDVSDSGAGRSGRQGIGLAGAKCAASPMAQEFLWSASRRRPTPLRTRAGSPSA